MSNGDPEQVPRQAADAPLLMTASELRDRQTMRRRQIRLSSRLEAIRRLAVPSPEKADPAGAQSRYDKHNLLDFSPFDIEKRVKALRASL
jgi:hypothetical protein